jgi:pimeloyl-ACP methyl ester carboxylesterase
MGGMLRSRIERAVDAGDFNRATALVMDRDLPPLQSFRRDPDVERRMAEIVDEHSWSHRSAKWPEDDWLEPPAYERMSDLALPVLAISGALDAPEFRAEGEYIARTAPDARCLTIASAAHYVNMEAPDAFNDAVVRFVNRVEAQLPA